MSLYKVYDLVLILISFVFMMVIVSWRDMLIEKYSQPGYHHLYWKQNKIINSKTVFEESVFPFTSVFISNSMVLFDLVKFNSMLLLSSFCSLVFYIAFSIQKKYFKKILKLMVE